MEELEKKELLKQQDKLKMASQKKKNEKSLAGSSSKVTDEDLTSGLLNITSKAWSTVPVVNYGSSSEEDWTIFESHREYNVFLCWLFTNIFLFPLFFALFTPVQPIVIHFRYTD